MLTGSDRILSDKSLRKSLEGRRVALMGHPASVTADIKHVVDAFSQCKEFKLTAAFGPQHGMRGDKQDNMVESSDYTDPAHGIPVFSLYGDVRRPTAEMLKHFDVLLYDLQDVGCRIYTFLTTLFYLIEDCAKNKKEIWVLDRPNPVGRPVDGTTLLPGQESFVGGASLPMRHGMTVGEAALWYTEVNRIDVNLKVIEMEGYDPTQRPGFGWPTGERTWINPSPNIPTLSSARCFPGTVLIEGTTLSEGRGTTRALENFGAPDIHSEKILKKMNQLSPEWLKGCKLRACYFEPMFHKHVGKTCSGIQIHVDDEHYDHNGFRPYRVVALYLKSIRVLYPDYSIWRDFYYEYEKNRLAIDMLNGGSGLREWVDDSQSAVGDLEKVLQKDEQNWIKVRKKFLLYPN